MLILFVHDLLFVGRRDLKEAAAGQWRIGSSQSTIDDRSQVALFISSNPRRKASHLFSILRWRYA
jgi:hypothetical protein